MAETFTWIPDYGSGIDAKADVITAGFGDGYSQRVPNGINWLQKTVNLTFTQEIPVVEEIIAFFEARAGVEYFLFTPPRESSTGKWVCSTWKRDYTKTRLDRVSATFTRVFDLG